MCGTMLMLIISKGERISIQLMKKRYLKRRPTSKPDWPSSSTYTLKVTTLKRWLMWTFLHRISVNRHFHKATLTSYPGFTAGNEKGELVTLGRNGSDYSAAVLAACLRADYLLRSGPQRQWRLQLWPALSGWCRLLKSLSYQSDGAFFAGASVLHPKTIAPIAQFHIPCLIKNSFQPTVPGTDWPRYWWR